MTTPLIHKARYYFPGIVVSETTSVTLDARSPELAALKADPYSFCFVLYDIPDPTGIDTPEGFNLTPKPQNESGRYYIEPRGVYTAATLPGTEGNLDILRRNMDSNGWDRVVQTRAYNWQPYTANDHIIKDGKVLDAATLDSAINLKDP